MDLTTEMARLLKSTQRRMLRMILGHGRRRTHRAQELGNGDNTSEDSQGESPATQNDDGDELEPWVEWIRRVTHNVENTMQKLKIRTWIEQARKRKWRYAAELFSGDGERKWSHVALEWNPQVHYDPPRPSARRRPTRPKLRWTDELRNHIKDRLRPEQAWDDVCSNPDFWKLHESTFINHEVN